MKLKKNKKQSIKILTMVKNCPLLFKWTRKLGDLALSLFNQIDLPYRD